MSAFESLTTRHPAGLTNASHAQTMGASSVPDPSYSHVYHNDFDTFNPLDFTNTTVGSGTVAAFGGDGGNLLLTTSNGAADSISLQLAQASFALKPGKFTFFKFSGVMSETINDSFFVGLTQHGATTQASITDGIIISKAAGSSALTLRSILGGKTVSIALPLLSAPSPGLPFELGLVVDYAGNLGAFFNPTTGYNPITAVVAANGQARGRVAALYALPATGAGLQLTTALLAPTVSYTNASSNARTLAIDYITVSRER